MRKMGKVARSKHATHFIRDNQCDEWVSPKFFEWLEHNMENWNKFCAVADKARKDGYGKWSARACMDVVRWAMGGPDRVKFSNSLTPEFARLYNHLYCRDVPFFTTRDLRKARVV